MAAHTRARTHTHIHTHTLSRWVESSFVLKTQNVNMSVFSMSETELLYDWAQCQISQQREEEGEKKKKNMTRRKQKTRPFHILSLRVLLHCKQADTKWGRVQLRREKNEVFSSAINPTHTRMYLWCGVYVGPTLYLLVCQVRVIVGDSGRCWSFVFM